MLGGARGDAVGRSTALQVGMSRVRFPIDLILPASRTLALGSTHPRTEMSTGGIFWEEGYRQPVRRAENLTISTSWSPKGLCMPVIG